MSDESATAKKVTHKYVGPSFVPGVPGRDLTQDDLDLLDENEMELLRRDAERATPAYKHVKDLGHSEQHKEAQKREKAAKAAEKKEG